MGTLQWEALAEDPEIEGKPSEGGFRGYLDTREVDRKCVKVPLHLIRLTRDMGALFGE
jgi:hypothetical protein